jgi:hypothetical protein
MDLVARNARLYPTRDLHPEPVDVGVAGDRIVAIARRGALRTPATTKPTTYVMSAPPSAFASGPAW